MTQNKKGKRRDISIVICTFNRAESLFITLNSIRHALIKSRSVSVVVVDNNSTDRTKDIVDSFKDDLDILYLFEGRKGKAFCQNKALNHGVLGDIVAFLDDDMTVDKNWLHGVLNISRRHPDCDIFTGNRHVIWPSAKVPGWATSGGLNDWGFSVQNRGKADHSIVPSRWPGGGHFWIRSKVLSCRIRFDEPITDEFASIGYVTDPDFVLQFFALGCKGMSGLDAVVGHRVQPHLLDKSNMRKRAKTVGRSIPYSRAVYPDFFINARILKKSLVLFWLAHCGKFLLSILKYGACSIISDNDKVFVCQMMQLAQISNHKECLIHTGRIRRKLFSNEIKLTRLRRKFHFN